MRTGGKVFEGDKRSLDLAIALDGLFPFSF